MDLDWIIILTNTLVSIGLFSATLYRIKIERDQVKTIISNAKAAEKLDFIRKTIEKEKDIILEMDNGEEFYRMLQCFFNEA